MHPLLRAAIHIMHLPCSVRLSKLTAAVGWNILRHQDINYSQWRVAGEENK